MWQFVKERGEAGTCSFDAVGYTYRGLTYLGYTYIGYTYFGCTYYVLVRRVATHPNNPPNEPKR